MMETSLRRAMCLRGFVVVTEVVFVVFFFLFFFTAVKVNVFVSLCFRVHPLSVPPLLVLR